MNASGAGFGRLILVVRVLLHKDRFSLKFELIVLLKVLQYIVQVHIVCHFPLCQSKIALSLHGHGCIDIAALDQVPVQHDKQVLFPLSLRLLLLDA